jgi:hypothetical protein
MKGIGAYRVCAVLAVKCGICSDCMQLLLNNKICVFTARSAAGACIPALFGQFCTSSPACIRSECRDSKCGQLNAEEMLLPHGAKL